MLSGENRQARIRRAAPRHDQVGTRLRHLIEMLRVDHQTRNAAITNDQVAPCAENEEGDAGAHQRRHIVIEGDDWFGPVSWTDADGTSGTLSHDELVAAVAPMRDGGENPDGEFIRAIQEGRAATPDLFTAVRAHQIVDAMYASAAADGAAVDVPAGDAS